MYESLVSKAVLIQKQGKTEIFRNAQVVVGSCCCKRLCYSFLFNSDYASFNLTPLR